MTTTSDIHETQGEANLAPLFAVVRAQREEDMFFAHAGF
jgi:hypothetical protein